MSRYVDTEHIRLCKYKFFPFSLSRVPKVFFNLPSIA